MFLKLLKSITSNSLSKTKLQQEGAGIIGEATFADTLGVISTAIGFIASILAYQDLLVPPIPPEGPVLPPFTEEKIEEYDDKSYSPTNLIVLFNILIIVTVIALFIFTCLLAGGICEPPKQPPSPKPPDPCSDC
jgi:hypothetical protein